MYEKLKDNGLFPETVIFYIRNIDYKKYGNNIQCGVDKLSQYDYRFTMDVRDTEHLERFIAKIKKISIE